MAILTQALSGLVFCMTLRAFQPIRIVRRMICILLEGVGLELNSIHSAVAADARFAFRGLKCFAGCRVTDGAVQVLMNKTSRFSRIGAGDTKKLTSSKSDTAIRLKNFRPLGPINQKSRIP